MGGSASLKACCLMYFLIQEKATMCTICITYFVALTRLVQNRTLATIGITL